MSVSTFRSLLQSLANAPKGAAKGKCLPAPKLAYELAVAVLRLSLDPARPPIHRETVQEVSPVLAAAYTKAQSTIPTYLGAGRSEDGLGLYRPKAGAYPVCRENAALCLKRLEQLGHPPARVAALLGLPDEAEMLAALADLPDYDAAVAASLAAPRPSSRAAADAGEAAEPPAERQENAKEAAPRKETAREYRERLEAAERAKEAERQAAAAAYHAEKRRAEQERAERDAPAIAEVMAQLTDDEE
jgi:hypothetical protein